MCLRIFCNGCIITCLATGSAFLTGCIDDDVRKVKSKNNQLNRQVDSGAGGGGGGCCQSGECGCGGGSQGDDEVDPNLQNPGGLSPPIGQGQQNAAPPSGSPCCPGGCDCAPPPPPPGAEDAEEGEEEGTTPPPAAKDSAATSSSTNGASASNAPAPSNNAGRLGRQPPPPPSPPAAPEVESAPAEAKSAATPAAEKSIPAVKAPPSLPSNSASQRSESKSPLTGGNGPGSSGDAPSAQRKSSKASAKKRPNFNYFSIEIFDFEQGCAPDDDKGSSKTPAGSTPTPPPTSTPFAGKTGGGLVPTQDVDALAADHSQTTPTADAQPKAADQQRRAEEIDRENSQQDAMASFSPPPGDDEVATSTTKKLLADHELDGKIEELFLEIHEKRAAISNHWKDDHNAFDSDGVSKSLERSFELLGVYEAGIAAVRAAPAPQDPGEAAGSPEHVDPGVGEARESVIKNEEKLIPLVNILGTAKYHPQFRDLLLHMDEVKRAFFQLAHGKMSSPMELDNHGPHDIVIHSPHVPHVFAENSAAAAAHDAGVDDDEDAAAKAEAEAEEAQALKPRLTDEHGHETTRKDGSKIIKESTTKIENGMAVKETSQTHRSPDGTVKSTDHHVVKIKTMGSDGEPLPSKILAEKLGEDSKDALGAYFAKTEHPMTDDGGAQSASDTPGSPTDQQAQHTAPPSNGGKPDDDEGAAPQPANSASGGSTSSESPDAGLNAGEAGLNAPSGSSIPHPDTAGGGSQHAENDWEMVNHGDADAAEHLAAEMHQMHQKHSIDNLVEPVPLAIGTATHDPFAHAMHANPGGADRLIDLPGDFRTHHDHDHGHEVPLAITVSHHGDGLGPTITVHHGPDQPVRPAGELAAADVAHAHAHANTPEQVAQAEQAVQDALQAKPGGSGDDTEAGDADAQNEKDKAAEHQAESIVDAFQNRKPGEIAKLPGESPAQVRHEIAKVLPDLDMPAAPPMPLEQAHAAREQDRQAQIEARVQALHDDAAARMDHALEPVRLDHGAFAPDEATVGPAANVRPGGGAEAAIPFDAPPDGWEMVNQAHVPDIHDILAHAQHAHGLFAQQPPHVPAHPAPHAAGVAIPEGLGVPQQQRLRRGPGEESAAEHAARLRAFEDQMHALAGHYGDAIDGAAARIFDEAAPTANELPVPPGGPNPASRMLLQVDSADQPGSSPHEQAAEQAALQTGQQQHLSPSKSSLADIHAHEQQLAPTDAALEHANIAPHSSPDDSAAPAMILEESVTHAHEQSNHHSLQPVSANLQSAAVAGDASLAQVDSHHGHPVVRETINHRNNHHLSHFKVDVHDDIHSRATEDSIHHNHMVDADDIWKRYQKHFRNLLR